jgi:pimeloyl-ACP methyl ester carboxylesterase
MPFATTNDGQEIYHEDHGSNGPVLVMVSGYMGIANIWQPLIDKLKPNYRCIAYDNRGFGRSSKPESPDVYSIPRHAGDLAAVLDHLKVDSNVILVTHSTGGNIASAFYLCHPGRVSGIVSSGTYFDGKSLIELGVTGEHLTAGFDLPSTRISFFVSIGLDHSLAIEAAKWPVYAIKNNARAILNYEAGNTYSEITVPCLIIQGAEDKIAPVDACARPIVAAIPTCTLKLLEGVNHFTITEAVEEVCILVDNFAKTLPQQAF